MGQSVSPNFRIGLFIQYESNWIYCPVQDLLKRFCLLVQVFTNFHLAFLSIITIKQNMLSPSKKHQTNRSPVKENISPRKRHSQPQSLNGAELAKELLLVLRKENVPVTNYLESRIYSTCKINSEGKLPFSIKCIDSETQLKETKLKAPKQSPLHQSKTDQDLRDTVKRDESKALQIKLNDYQFQLKKMEEDFAQHKVITRMEKEKIIKKHSQEIEALKKKIQEDNNSWELRFKKTLEEHQSEKQHFQNQTRARSQKEISEESSKLKETYLKKIETLEEKVAQLERELQVVRSQSCQKTEELKVSHEEQTKAITQNLKQQISTQQKQLTSKFELRLSQSEIKKKEELAKLEEIILEEKQSKQKLERDIYYLSKDKEELKRVLRVNEQKILQMELTIKSKEHEMVVEKQKFEQQVSDITKTHVQEIGELKESHRMEANIMRQDHLNELDSYYTRINKIEEAKQSIESQHKETLQVLESKFQERVSKCEDVDMIRDLKCSLSLKDREIAKVKEDCRKKELILKNNEKNYTKIFSSTCGQRKSSVNSHRDKDAFFRQTNATDLKMVLKICNKDF